MTAVRERDDARTGPANGTARPGRPDGRASGGAGFAELAGVAGTAALVRLARRGLTEAYRPDSGRFPQTMRGLPGTAGPQLRAEGDSPRYAAIAALGLARLTETAQREVLSGSTAAELACQVAVRAAGSSDPGLVALAAWAAAETADTFTAGLFDELAARVRDHQPIPTVDLSWALTAAVTARHLGPTEALIEVLAARLLGAQGRSGAFPHRVPANTQPRYRRHIGCFADQVYPIQALARLHATGAEPEVLEAANRCAAVITGRQGAEGQWWWHYDVRDGSVVEGFPVYSVHQHAMGPMALGELRAVGGDDHRAAVDRGLDWLTTHPEVVGELVSERLGVVWRKVGRRERKKVVRAAAALTTSLRPGLRIGLLDSLCPPGWIDYECRPYELGWLLYVWAGDGVGR